MTDEQTTGTPPTDDGDAAAQSPTTGTPNGDGRDADSGETDYKALHLANKGTIEQLKAELAEFRARADQPPADQDDDEQSTDTGKESDRPRLTREDIVRLEDLSLRGDVAAKGALVDHYERQEIREMQRELARNTRDAFHIRDIADPAERQEVVNLYTKNKHLPDIKTAKALVREPKLEARVRQLEKELEAAKKQPPTDVVRTHDREIPASQAKARKIPMATADFDREQAELAARGDWEKRRERQRQVMNDEIDLQ